VKRPSVLEILVRLLRRAERMAADEDFGPAACDLEREQQVLGQAAAHLVGRRLE
jgi:hypothetical protein